MTTDLAGQPRAVPLDLSPREQVILMLADGDSPTTIAALLETEVPAVREVGKAYGYPQNKVHIRAVAMALREGERDNHRHAGALPGCPWPPPIAGPRTPHAATLPPLAPAPEPVTPPEVTGPAAATPPTGAEQPPTQERAVADPAPAAASHEATLTMPLGRLITADGREVLLGIVEIDVRINIPGVMEALAGELLTGTQAGHLVVPTRIERRLTLEGAAALRALAGLLPDTGREEDR